MTPGAVEIRSARENEARARAALRAAEARIAQLEAANERLRADLRLLPTAGVLAGRLDQVTGALRAVVDDLVAVAGRAGS